MKTVILILFLFSNFIIMDCLGQTHCYKYLYSVNRNDEKMKDEINRFIYVTFTKSKQYFYFSDKDGYQDSTEDAYMFTSKSSSNVLKYENPIIFEKINFSDGGKVARKDIWKIYGKEIYFSSDYSRLNIHFIGEVDRRSNKPVAVYEITSSETPEDFNMY